MINAWWRKWLTKSKTLGYYFEIFSFMPATGKGPLKHFQIVTQTTSVLHQNRDCKKPSLCPCSPETRLQTILGQNTWKKCFLTVLGCTLKVSRPHFAIQARDAMPWKGERELTAEDMRNSWRMRHWARGVGSCYFWAPKSGQQLFVSVCRFGQAAGMGVRTPHV